MKQRKEYQTAVDRSDNTDPCYNKKMCTLNVDFEICSESELFQDAEVVEQIKYLRLIQHLIAQAVTKEVIGGSPRDAKT